MKKSKTTPKKIITLLFLATVLLSCAFVFSACDSADNALPTLADIEENADKAQNDEPKKEESKKEEVRVTVTNKKNIPKNTSQGRYSDRVEFTFKLDNLTAKSIKGIQGTLTVYNLFDDEIISLNCDFTGNTISANGTITVGDIGIDINQFMDNNVKLYNEDFDDLKFKYEVKNIVYSGDSSNSQQNDFSNSEASSKVQVMVTNKYNLDEDWNAGRYSPRVEFGFKITNKSSKTIKGVQGTLIIKDLFGEDFISINCDFTGNTISPNSYITVGDLGIDINQFMDNHVKLYNEKYSDLNFEYDVKTIVYTDGTSDSYN
ncbi:MAG: hypothetical protein IJY93_07255 [Clostridia bacterium]|nr:hypothetical protein [Clostridia bacterium]